MDLRPLLVIDPGHPSRLKVPFEFFFLTALDHWFAPLAIDKLGAHQGVQAVLLEQFNPHIA